MRCQEDPSSTGRQDASAVWSLDSGSTTVICNSARDITSQLPIATSELPLPRLQARNSQVSRLHTTHHAHLQSSSTSPQLDRCAASLRLAGSERVQRAEQCKSINPLVRNRCCFRKRYVGTVPHAENNQVGCSSNVRRCYLTRSYEREGDWYSVSKTMQWFHVGRNRRSRQVWFRQGLCCWHLFGSFGHVWYQGSAKGCCSEGVVGPHVSQDHSHCHGPWLVD